MTQPTQTKKQEPFCAFHSPYKSAEEIGMVVDQVLYQSPIIIIWYYFSQRFSNKPFKVVGDLNIRQHSSHFSTECVRLLSSQIQQECPHARPNKRKWFVGLDEYAHRLAN